MFSPAQLLPLSAGTYALWFWLARPLTLAAGRLGTVRLGPGAVVYVGSARGPGGLRARVGRHLRGDGRPHWHIDALTARVPVSAVWYTSSSRRLECVWAAQLRAISGAAIPIAGFGASDCTCPAHLLAIPLTALPLAWQTLGRPAVLILWSPSRSADAAQPSGAYGRATPAMSDKAR